MLASVRRDLLACAAVRRLHKAEDDRCLAQWDATVGQPLLQQMINQVPQLALVKGSLSMVPDLDDAIVEYVGQPDQCGLIASSMGTAPRKVVAADWQRMCDAIMHDDCKPIPP